MTPDLTPLGRGLLLLGALLALFGTLLLLAPKLPWIGRLPGDILIQRDRFTFYFPLASSLVASVLLSLLLWLFTRGGR
jgi:hypothetical protein